MTNKEKEKAIAKIKDIQNDLGCFGLNDKFYNDEEKERINALNVALEALEQESCEIIEEIPKDYMYDTETKDFWVYRHKYTGNEIHIEKPVPRYRLEQEPCEDAISRKEALDSFKPRDISDEAWEACETYKKLTALPPVRPTREHGEWIVNYDAECDDYGNYPIECSVCGACGGREDFFPNFCHKCGADMRNEVNTITSGENE